MRFVFPATNGTSIAIPITAINSIIILLSTSFLKVSRDPELLRPTRLAGGSFVFPTYFRMEYIHQPLFLYIVQLESRNTRLALGSQSVTYLLAC